MSRREPDGDTGVEVTISRLRSLDRRLSDLEAWVAGKLPHDHTGTHRKDDRPLVVGAADMAANTGSPVVAKVGGRWSAFAFDDASTERVAGIVDVPASWSTFDVEMWHSTTTGNSGTARVRVRELTPSAGDSLSGEDSGGGLVSVSAVATADTLGVATIRTGQSAVAGLTLITAEREGQDGSDDLTGDFLVLAVVLRKAS